MSDESQETEDLPGLLAAALSELSQAVAIIDELTEAEPYGFVRWGMALYEARRAKNALLRAPSVTAISERPPAKATGEDWAELLGDLATSVQHSLINASDQLTDPDDKLACLNAAMYSARLRESLG